MTTLEARLPRPDDLRRLAEVAGDPCVTVYLPTHRAGAEIRQDPILLRNLLDRAERSLGERGARARSLLEPARALQDDDVFWRHQDLGLALYLTPGRAEALHLPREVEPFVQVGPAFHLKPLVPALEDRRFRVLALSRKQVRLLEATRDTVERLDLGDVPASLADALGHDWTESTLQYHTGAPPSGEGRRRAMFHGQQQGGEVDKNELLRFCQILDAGLRSLLEEDREVPVVLAADESVAAVFRRVTDLPDVLEDVVSGNHEATRDDVLRDRGWELVSRRLANERERRLARVAEGLGTALGSDDVEEIVRAAHDGRVATLVVPREAHRWGRWHPDRRTAELHDEAEPGDEDLLDVALRATVTHGGQVQVVDGAVVLDGRAAAAAFRH